MFDIDVMTDDEILDVITDYDLRFLLHVLKSIGKSVELPHLGFEINQDGLTVRGTMVIER